VSEGLQIENPNAIAISDIHRLPQQPIFDKNNREMTRPIIVKFSTIFDKRHFIQNLKHYNEQRKLKDKSAIYVYATEHHPKALQLQKKKLKGLFDAARKAKRRTDWKIENNEYCLYDDNQRVRLDDA